MKFVLLFLCLGLSPSVFAVFNEVECKGQLNQKKVTLEVERPFPNGSLWRKSLLTIEENGSLKTFTYDMTIRNNQGPDKVRYESSGFNLQIDFWPHQRPQSGYTYRGVLFARELNGQLSNLNCIF